MKPVSSQLADHLNDTQTTMCSCWIVARQDGIKLGFTDHDFPLNVDGVLCEPETGFNGGGTEHSSGLNADSWSADGILSSDTITDEDLKAGLYDRAVIEQWLVNWNEPKQAMRLTRALTGEVMLADNQYTVELRSITALLDRDQTRFFASDCDAELGDQRCGVDLSTLAVAASVLTVRENNRATLQLIRTIERDSFQDGSLVLDDGRAARILEVTALANPKTIDVILDRPLAGLQSAQPVTLKPGCDKRFSTCKKRYFNAVNFRGFPHIPGGENALNYADEEGEYNGEPLVR